SLPLAETVTYPPREVNLEASGVEWTALGRPPRERRDLPRPARTRRAEHAREALVRDPRSAVPRPDREDERQRRPARPLVREVEARSAGGPHLERAISDHQHGIREAVIPRSEGVEGEGFGPRAVHA